MKSRKPAAKKPAPKKPAPKARAKSIPAQKAKHEIALVFDTETTGLIRNGVLPLDRQPEIVEFYGCYVDLESGKIIKELERVFKPSRKMGDDVIKIHGITNEMVEKAPPFAAFAREIMEFIEGADVVIAHNLSYDLEIVELECCKRLGEAIAWPRKLCTVEQTAHLKGYRLSLTVLHEMLFGEKFPSAHRARHDVIALTRCCVELRKRGLI